MVHLNRSTAAATDLRDQPAYTLTEASRYLKLPSATLRSWIVGRRYPKAQGTVRSLPLIHPTGRNPPVLSFWNLIEAHVLRSLRTDHEVSLKAVRDAIRYAEKALDIQRLLLDQKLQTDAGQVFLERYGELISLSASGQLAMKKVFEAHLKRVEWDARQFPVRLFPFVSAQTPDATAPIAIDSQLAFGRPIVRRLAISTSTIADRIDAGETVADLTSDYGLSQAEIEEAVLYERAA